MHATAVHQANTWFSVGGMVTLLPRGPVDGAVVCATIERERVTLLSLVGDVILRRIVGALEEAEARGEPYDLSSLRRVHNSGAMVNAALKDALLSRGTMSFYDSLGSSEAVGFGLALTDRTGRAHHGAVRARAACSGRHRGRTRRRARFGRARPARGRPQSSAIGYYKDPERSAATFREIDGTPYAMPGDWAIVHDDQTITLLGRGSGCINTGGEKVWPEEVEEVLKNHPAVVDAIVVGLPDDEWGESVAAVVSLGADHDGDDADARRAVGVGRRAPRVVQAPAARRRRRSGAADDGREGRLRVGARRALLSTRGDEASTRRHHRDDHDRARRPRPARRRPTPHPPRTRDQRTRAR